MAWAGSMTPAAAHAPVASTSRRLGMTGKPTATPALPPKVSSSNPPARTGRARRRRHPRRTRWARPGWAAVVPGERDQLLDRPHRQPLGDDPRGQLLLRGRVIDRKQGTGVPGCEYASGDPALDRDGQVEQPDRVRDLGAAAADALRELLVRRAELVEQLTIGGGLLERVELDP